jgi:hypothetical protein
MVYAKITLVMYFFFWGLINKHRFNIPRIFFINSELNLLQMVDLYIGEVLLTQISTLTTTLY